MKRPYRWILAVLAAMVLLPLAAALFIIVAVDPNVFRGQIESAARTRLGLPLSLEGDLRWSVWPLLAIEAGAGRLGEGGAASDVTLARWRKLQFGARWRGLLYRQLIVDRLLIEELQLDLRRDAQGGGNWTALADDAAGARAATDNSTQAGRPLRVAALQLRDARITFSDAQRASIWRVDQLRFDSGVDYDPLMRRLTLEDLALQSQVGGGWLPAPGLPVELTAGQLAVDIGNGELQLPVARLQLGQAQLELTLSEALMIAPLTGSGTLRVTTDSLRTTLAALGIEAPPTSDDDVLGELMLQTTWQATATRLDLQELRIEADDTVLTGSAMWPLDDSSPALFELAGDDIDLDRYLRPAGAPREPFSLPVDELRALEVQGSVSFRTVKLQGVTMRDARFTVPRS